jgi:transposase
VPNITLCVLTIQRNAYSIAAPIGRISHTGLEDRSHQVHHHPWRTSAEIEEAICELRRGHPKWGPRRLVFEMGRRGHQVTRSSVYRTLVRNGLVEPKSRRRRRKDYRRWERSAAMELWQLDVTASAFLTMAPR